ncbi:diaminopimelate decarboxylase [bacterium]|nr:diaminopimelate decarboxylase [bacterium]
MNAFNYQNGELMAEGVPLSLIADTYDTPCYVYSRAQLVAHYQAYAQSLGDHPGIIHYAVKANSNLAVLQVLAEQGAGFDIVSGGELARVLKAGGAPERIVFSGVGKSAEDIKAALEANIGCFNVESQAELVQLQQVAESLNVKAPVSIRVNPDVDANTHPYISTGLKENKFGIDINLAPAVYQQAAAMANLEVIGVDCHIGSQLTTMTPFLDALKRLLALIDTLNDQGITIKHLDMGGGLGITYEQETPPSVETYISAIKHALDGRDLALCFEPGRSIAANAGVLLMQVMYLKPTEHKDFAIVDAAMNDNIRPSLYQAWQDIQPLKEQSEGSTSTWDIVGPVCETGDFLAKDRELTLSQGDYLALMSSGAYGFVMSSNYNSRPKIPEIMVDGRETFEVRRRETVEELMRGEQLLPKAP